jgi:benzoylformate decarboxylase
MADGFAQARRGAALVNLHSSAGVGNALGNLFTAYKNQTPLVVTAGQQARSILPFEPFLYAERPTEFPRPFVKWACEPARAKDVPLAIARAYHEAMTPPCGPAFVSIPVDDWDRMCSPVAAREMATLNPGDPCMIDRLTTAVQAADRPAFVLGAGTARDDAWESLLQLAEQERAAVYAGTYSCRNVFPEDHRLFGGFLPAFREQLVDRLSGHDLIVSFGGALNIYHAEGAGPHLPAGAQLWTVGDSPGALASAPEGNAILGNTRSIALQMLGRSSGCNRAGPAARAAPAPLDRGRFDDRMVFSQIAAARPPEAIVVEEAPSSRPAMHEHLRFTEPDTFFTTGSGGLGYAMPAAVGIALARPDARVIAILGDGSAMYSEQALFAATQLNASVTFVVINNGGYEALRQFGQGFAMTKVPGADINGLDFTALAVGHGMNGARVDNADDFQRSLAKSFASDGPLLIEACVQASSGSER